MNTRLSWLAPAKINLYLHVLNRRPDGYHELDSLVAFTAFGDTLSARPTDDISLFIDGPRAAALDDDALHSNLVFKAARLLRAKTGTQKGAAIHLQKRLPIAAGLGGGSADAAAALKMLDDLWGLNTPKRQLAEWGGELGADVPVCVLSELAFMGGIGEQLRPVELVSQNLNCVIAHTGIALPTASVFGALQPHEYHRGRLDRPVNSKSTDQLIDFLHNTSNNLEAPALRLQPEIGTLLDALRANNGCLLARMSGSGAACFALFENAALAAAAARDLNQTTRFWAVATDIGI